MGWGQFWRILGLYTFTPLDHSPINDETIANQPDGPGEYGWFHWQGKSFSGLSGKPWHLVNELWNAKDKTCSIDHLAYSVWKTENAANMDNNALRSPRRHQADTSKAKGRPSRRNTADRFAVLNAFVDAGMVGLSRVEIGTWLTLYRDTRNGTASPTAKPGSAVRSASGVTFTLTRHSAGKTFRRRDTMLPELPSPRRWIGWRGVDWSFSWLATIAAIASGNG